MVPGKRSTRRASPAAIKVIEAMNREVDARPALRSMPRADARHEPVEDRMEPVAQARRIAGAILGARIVELPGVEHPPFLGDADRVVDELYRFITSIRREGAGARARAGDCAVHRHRRIHRSSGGAATAPGEMCRNATTNSCARCSPRYRGVEVDTAGVGFFAGRPGSPVRCATAIIEAVKPLASRCGPACTPVGRDDRGKDRWDGRRHRISGGATAQASEVLVSQTVKDLVAGSGLIFEDTGEHELKGVPDRRRLYWVVS